MAARATTPTPFATPNPACCDPVASLPPFAAIQAWVHRPQAVARCGIRDVISLRALAYDNGEVSHCKRDAFLLDHFPCRVVEIVAWVAGVMHRETTVTVTLDDGNGLYVLEAVVRLAEIDVPQPRKAEQSKRTFASAHERKQTGGGYFVPKSEEARLFVRPDIRVGDTVRVVGRVEEWARGGKDWVRQLAVNEAAGVGYIRVVDPDEEYVHVAEVRRLRAEVYSRPFEMPAAPTPGPSPSKSVMSSIASDCGDDDEEEEDEGPDLPDPSMLSASRLTEATFKLYVVDYMTRETARQMRAVLRRRRLLHECIPELAALFPEYLHATTKKRPLREQPPQHANVFDVSGRDASVCEADEHKTPRATFRSKREREAARSALPDDKTPVATGRTFRSRSDDATFNTSSVSHGTQTSSPLSAYTIPLILAVPTLRDLAARIVDHRARHEEKHRRHRAKHGKPTLVDQQVVAARLARGLSEGSYKLSASEREAKMCAMTEWLLRQASKEGSVVEVYLPQPATENDSPNPYRRPAPAVGYLPLPPELLAPLLAPVVAAHKLLVRGTFRSQLERAARDKDNSSTLGAGAGGRITAAAITKRLRKWDLRWERVGEWAAAAALEWGEAHGVFDL